MKRAKTLLSLTYTEGIPGYLMYIHDSKSLFNKSADFYQTRRFLPLGPFENFKRTVGSCTNFLIVISLCSGF